MLQLAIRRAERDGKAARNVAALAEVPAGPRRQSKSMNLEQIRALLGLDLTAWWRAYITVALMCGLRPGELLGLRWEDVDFKAGVIRVRKCLKALPDPVTGKRALVLETLKTERSKRTIRMPRQVVAVLLALRKEQAAARLKLGALYDVRGLLIVFGDGAGAPKWPQDVLEALQYAVRSCRDRRALDTTGAAALVRERAQQRRGGHRTDRRCRRARQLDDHQGRVPSPDRRRGHLGRHGDGCDFRRCERLVDAIGSASWLPNGSRTLGYLRWNRISVIPCEGIGSPRGGRRVP
jgi:integrase